MTDSADPVEPTTKAGKALLNDVPVSDGMTTPELSARIVAIEAEARASAEKPAVLPDALTLLGYLWQEANVERGPKASDTMPKVRDLFSPDDPLALDIEAALTRADQPAQGAEEVVFDAIRKVGVSETFVAGDGHTSVAMLSVEEIIDRARQVLSET
jgi:hypothetical protein